MSPLLEPPAARPHATDPAPCLNRCSINNACFSATHLPGGQIGKTRAEERGREGGREGEREGERGGMSEWVCLEGGQAGSRMGKNPEAGVTTGRWIGHARRSQRTSEPGDEVSSSSHLLQRRTGGGKLCVVRATNLTLWSCFFVNKDLRAYRWKG